MGTPTESLWLFGYSSLIWKYDEVEHVETDTGFIEGYQRRFWQGSTDHRGTPERPGLVASLYSKNDFKRLKITDDPALNLNAWRVHGRAFRISGKERDRMVAALNDREVDGYTHHWLTVYKHNEHGDKIVLAPRALTYIADVTNPQFAGYMSDRDIVSRILKCAGNSGSNREYLENLAGALREIDVADLHLDSLIAILHGKKEMSLLSNEN